MYLSPPFSKPITAMILFGPSLIWSSECYWGYSTYTKNTHKIKAWQLLIRYQNWCHRLGRNKW